MKIAIDIDNKAGTGTFKFEGAKDEGTLELIKRSEGCVSVKEYEKIFDGADLNDDEYEGIEITLSAIQTYMLTSDVDVAEK